MKLQDALTAVADRIIPESEWWAGWHEYLIIVEAARRVVSPDIDAAAIFIAVALAEAVSLATGQAVVVDFIDDEMKAIAKGVVLAALGITEDE